MSLREGAGKRIVILGAGPTGLGAAYRLRELGHRDWDIYEATDTLGGLARSYTDERGFTYDIGGHVMFSHYPYFDRLVDTLLGEDYTRIQREAWVWMRGRWVPYPFQNNIRHLPPDELLECLLGLIEAQKEGRDPKLASNFKEFNLAQFGDGISKHFMLPYNFKVWAHPPELMSKEWIGERVPLVDIGRILRNVILGEDDVSWGPNNSFKFPLHGGTGGLYSRYEPYVRDWLHLNKRAVAVDPDSRTVTFDDGDTTGYDLLLSTMPLTELLPRVSGCPEAVREAASGLLYSSGYSIGVGVARPTEGSKCWIYYPEPDAPFYRVTHLSHYSPHIAPPGTTLYLTETSESAYKPVDRDALLEDTIQGLINVGLMRPDERELILATKVIRVEHWYPIPSVGRDRALAAIQPYLMERGIYSRGRFGAWCYEIGNMDHSTMMGVEFVNLALQGEPEETWKLREVPEPIAALEASHGPARRDGPPTAP
jgi:protoporphyrinogen oxidase